MATGDTLLKDVINAGFVMRPAGGSNGQALGLAAGVINWLDINSGGNLVEPDAPIVGTIDTSEGPGTVKVPFDFATTGALAATATVILSNGDVLRDLTASPAVFTGEPTTGSLTAQVFASNAAGDSPLSAVSNAVTPTSPSAAAAPIIVQSFQANSGGTMSASLVPGTTVTPGNLVVALVAWSADPTQGGPLNLPAGFELLKQVQSPGISLTQAWYAKDATGSGDNPTFTGTGTGGDAFMNVVGWEVSGAAVAGFVNANEAQPTTGLAQTTPSVTPTVLNCLPLAGFQLGPNSPSLSALTTGWTADQFANGSTGGFNALVGVHGNTPTSDTTTPIAVTATWTSVSGSTGGDAGILLIGPTAAVEVQPSVPTIAGANASGATSVNVTVQPGTTGVPTTIYVQAFIAGVASGVPTQAIANGQSAVIVTVPNLTTGTAYTFEAAAGNDIGRSAYSAASSPVTPNTTTGVVAQAVFIDSSTGGALNVALVPGYESWLGTSLTAVLGGGVRGSYAQLIAPNYIISQAVSAGKKLIISFDVFISGSTSPLESWSTFSVSTNVTSSGETVAARCAAFVANLVAQGAPDAVIRVNQEFNTASGTFTTSGGVPAIYGHTGANGISDVTNWINFWRIFEAAAAGVTGWVGKLDWNPSVDPGDSHNPCLDAWPGDAYAHIVGLDSYFTSVPFGANYTTDADQWTRRKSGYNGGIGLDAYAAFAAARNSGAGLPLSIPEWGLGYYYNNGSGTQAPSDPAYLVTQMIAWINANNVLYESFWEDYDRGIYTAHSHPAPNSALAMKGGLGSQTSGAWF